MFPLPPLASWLFNTVSTNYCIDLVYSFVPRGGKIVIADSPPPAEKVSCVTTYLSKVRYLIQASLNIQSIHLV